jgi:hypothetical protein
MVKLRIEEGHQGIDVLLTTAERDASGRLADELSRLVVDDLLRIDWTGDKDAKGKENAK